MSFLHAIGLNTDLLQSILTEEIPQQVDIHVHVPEHPSYGVLLELMTFSANYAVSGSSKPKIRIRNAILKTLIDKLFPVCSVSRADRLARRIKQLLLPLESFSNHDDEKVIFLNKTWRPQPTGE